MRLLDDAHWIAQTYELVGRESGMLDDLEIVKRALVEAIARSHLDHTGLVNDQRKQAALDFVSPYHNIFTTNYDLLIYWVNMSNDPPLYEDGFRADVDDREAPYLVFAERIGAARGLFYLHGALHLYSADGKLRKHSWVRTGRRLTELIREGLAAHQYPLFVAEGSSQKKVSQIQQSSYLSYCIGKLGRVENRIVIFGHSLGDTDAHVFDAIAMNADISELYVGLHGRPDSEGNRATQAVAERLIERRAQVTTGLRRARQLAVYFYATETALPWGEEMSRPLLNLRTD